MSTLALPISNSPLTWRHTFDTFVLNYGIHGCLQSENWTWKYGINRRSIIEHHDLIELHLCNIDRKRKQMQLNKLLENFAQKENNVKNFYLKELALHGNQLIQSPNI